MSLEFSGPGIRRQSIPDGDLSHRDLGAASGTNDSIPGLAVNVFSGHWARLPDFSEWPVVNSYVARNFEVTPWLAESNMGLVFSGNLQVARSGEYKIYLKTVIGSRIYLGRPERIARLLGDGVVPEPTRNFIGSIVKDDGRSQWMQFEGYVRFIATRSGHLEVELRSTSNSRMEFVLLDDTGWPAALLMNSKLQVRGVGGSEFSTGGQLIWGSLTAVDGRSVHILELASPVWAAYPMLSPGDAIKELALGEGKILHVFGQLCATEDNSPLVLKDAKARLLVERTEETAALAGRPVEAVGIGRRSGTNWWLTNLGLREYSAFGNNVKLPQLTTAAQVAELDRNEAAKRYPVHLRGVVTCIWPDYFRNFVLQDSTRGVFVQVTAAATGLTEIHPGDFLEIDGYTVAGVFSPMVRTPNAKYLGVGRFPEPVQPAWDQLVNGSLDNQYVEIEGILMGIQHQSLTLLTHWGKISINVTDQDPAVFEKYENKLVRLRGCLLALWDDKTHTVKAEGIRLQNAIVNVDESPPAKPFATPSKSLSQLRQFDVHAAAFQRVHIAGTFVSRRGNEFFLMESNLGLRFIADRTEGIKPGDRVDVVGYPELGGPSPVLRDAIFRKAGEGSLPPPKKLELVDLADAELDATRVQIAATLLNARVVRSEVVLEMQAGLRLFLASYQANQATLPSLRTGSRLQLTGVYASLVNRSGVEGDLDAFELLLDSPAAVTILSQPPWWTLKRLAIAVGILSSLLSLVALWVFQLRRRVEAQTDIIREKAESQATLEERNRIARDLHDTMEQALAGISFQLGALAGTKSGLAAETQQGLERARLMVRHAQAEARRTVRNLRMFSLERNNLCWALEHLARENARGTDVSIAVAVSGQPILLPAEIENHLLRIGQEVMTNSLKHAQATSIKIQLAYEADFVALKIADNGRGFEAAPTTSTAGDHFGLLGVKERTEKVNGTLHILSQPGTGTEVLVKVPYGTDTARS